MQCTYLKTLLKCLQLKFKFICLTLTLCDKLLVNMCFQLYKKKKIKSVLNLYIVSNFTIELKLWVIRTELNYA